MTLVNMTIEKVPNDKLEENLIINKTKIPEVYRIGILKDDMEYYGIFIDRKTRRTYALKYIINYDKAFASGIKTIAKDITDESEWNMIVDSINKYNIISNFEIYEKKLMLQWYFMHKGKSFIRKDLYEHRYEKIKNDKKLPNGVDVVTYNSEADLLKKIDENNNG